MNKILIENCLRCGSPCDCKPEEHEAQEQRGYNVGLYACHKCATEMGPEMTHAILHARYEEHIKQHEQPRK